MKTQTHIEFISAGEIADLLGKAFSSSEWLAFQPAKNATDGLVFDDAVSVADHWAQILTAGRMLEALDIDANYTLYGQLDGKRLNEDGEGVYLFDLNDLLRGLQAAADGTFEPGGCPMEIMLAQESFCHLKTGDLDEGDAERLKQVVLFNEIVY